MISIRKYYDSLESYGYSERFKEGSDEKGEYVETIITQEVPCTCHPETCTHFSGKKTEVTSKKEYKAGGRG